MRKLWAVLVACAFGAAPSLAEAPLAARTIRAGATVTADDISPANVTSTEALELIGQQSRVTVYAGRPMRAEDFGAPQVITRNQVVTLVFRRGSLVIRAEGRSLGQGAVGSSLRVLNTASHTTVSGSIQPDGTISVLPQP